MRPQCSVNQDIPVGISAVTVCVCLCGVVMRVVMSRNRQSTGGVDSPSGVGEGDHTRNPEMRNIVYSKNIKHCMVIHKMWIPLMHYPRPKGIKPIVW